MRKHQESVARGEHIFDHSFVANDVHRPALFIIPIYSSFHVQICLPNHFATECNDLPPSLVARGSDGVQCRARSRPGQMRALSVRRGDALRLCQLHSNRTSFKSRALLESSRSAPPHRRLQSLLRRRPWLQRDSRGGPGWRRHGRGRGRGGSSARRTTSAGR